MSKDKSEKCPVFLTLSLIANKWGICIIENLLKAENQTLRPTNLQKAIHGITQVELRKQLLEFEKAGIVTRKAYAEVPPRVEYKLTELGLSLMKPINELSDWSKENGEIVKKNREKYSKIKAE